MWLETAARLTARVCLVFVGVSVLSYSLVFLAPGDPAQALLQSIAEAPSPERLAQVRADLGLDDPVPVQYARWFRRIVALDLGTSFRTGEPVADILAARLLATLQLAGVAFAATVLLSSLQGAVAARFTNRFPDKICWGGAILLQSVPNYCLGLLLVYAFSLRLGLLPVSGQQGAASFVLPALTLCLAVSSLQGRVLRAMILDVAGRDHVRFALGKGLAPGRVWLRHILPNALAPILLLWGMTLGSLLGGAIIVESVFAWPGLGKLAMDAVLQRDIPVLQAVVLVMGLAFVLANALAETLRRRLEPHVVRTG